MVTKRQYPRYRAIVPLEFLYDPPATRPPTPPPPVDVQILTPDDIGLGGCYFSSPPTWLRRNSVPQSVRIPVDSTYVSAEITNFVDTYDLDQPENEAKLPTGLRVAWRVNPLADLSRLDTKLRATCSAPSTSDRLSFLTTEQRNFSTYLANIERSKFQRTTLLMTILVAYLGYLVAPYKLADGFAREAGAFYAIAGLWLSLVCLVHGNRYLHFLGTISRNKAFVLTAMNANRSYVFGNDPYYYTRTVFPLGPRYDAGRSWISDRANGSTEQPESRFVSGQSSLYPSAFIALIQLLFLGGLFHFSSILARIFSNGPPFSGPPGPAGSKSSLELFSSAYFISTCALLSFVAVGWIQLMGNRIIKYEQMVWEMRRIQPLRPNPRATGEAWRSKRFSGILRDALKVLGTLSVVFPVVVLALFALVPKIGSYTDNPLLQMPLAGVAFGIVGLFAALKFVDGFMSLWTETRSDASKRPSYPAKEPVVAKRDREG